MAFDKLKGECDREQLKIMFDLHEHISFGLDSFTGGEVVAGLMQLQLRYQTLTVEVDGKLAMRNGSRIVSHDKVEIQ